MTPRVASAARLALVTSTARLMLPRSAAPLVLLAAVFGAAPLTAQTLTGRVVEEGRDVPVPGASVSLLDREGERRALVLADSLGRYRIRPPDAGEYVIEVTQLGYAATNSPLLALGTEGTAELDLTLSPDALAIEGLEVSVEREARRELGRLGVGPAELGRRWLDRSEIEAIPGLPSLREALRGRGMPGVELPNDPHALCVEFRRGSGCALVVLDGTPLPPIVALDVRLDELGAIALLRPTEAMAFWGQRAAGGALLLWSR